MAVFLDMNINPIFTQVALNKTFDIDEKGSI